jgi:hypothetical protein
VLIVDFKQDSPMGPPVHQRVPPEQVADELGRGGLRAVGVPSSLPNQFLMKGQLPR